MALCCVMMVMCVNVTGQRSLEEHRVPSSGSRRSVSIPRTWKLTVIYNRFIKLILLK